MVNYPSGINRRNQEYAERLASLSPEERDAYHKREQEKVTEALLISMGLFLAAFLIFVGLGILFHYTGW